MAQKGGRQKGAALKYERGIVFSKGRWWARPFINGRQRWFRCDSKTQARAVYQKVKAGSREARYFPEKFKQSKDVTLRAWIGQYLEGVSSPGQRNMKQYGKFWSRLLGRYILSEISADDLRQLQAKMLAKGNRTPSTINRYFAGLRRFLNLAIAEGKLATNPVKGVKFFPEPTGRLRFLSDAELRRLQEAMTPEQWAPVALAVETGMRLTEQFKARWDCVDLERGVLTIPLSKSGRTRHVILTESAIAILRGLSSWLHSTYVFPSPINPGQPIQGRNFVAKVYMSALKRAGIQGVTWHTLRHTFASRAVMAGVDLRTVQELMGHSTPMMTSRYAHLSPAHLRAAVNKASLRSQGIGQDCPEVVRLKP